MKRLLATVRRDIVVQFRNGFYYASLFVAVVVVIILAQVRGLDLALILPVFIYQNIFINTFFFIAGLVLLEKGEGSLEGIVVTPLRHWEYLASKLITLVGLSVVESLAVVIFVYGLDFNWVLLITGITLLGAMYALVGFIFVARYDSLNEFLFPAIVAAIVLAIPLLDHFGLWSHPLIYLHPFQAPLVILSAAFVPAPAWEIAYGVLYAALWAVFFFRWALHVFGRFVVMKAGSVT